MTEGWRPRDPLLLPAYELWREERVDEARVAFLVLARRRPHDPDVWRGLGSVLWSREEYADALVCFRTALRLRPEDPTHWHVVGLALRDLGRLDRAAAALRAAVALDPEYHPALNELANVHVDTGRPDEALEIYARAIALEDGPAVYHHNRGVALRMTGRLDAAEASFRRALRRDPAYRHSLRELTLLASR